MKRREKQKKQDLKKRRHLSELAQQEQQYRDSVKAREAVRPTFNRGAFSMSGDTEQNAENKPVLDKRTSEKPKSVGFDRSLWKVNNE